MICKQLFDDMNSDTNPHTLDQSEKTLQGNTLRQKYFADGFIHEFRTPISSIQLGIDSLKNTYMSEDQTMQIIESLECQCNSLLQLVDNFHNLLTVRQEVNLKKTCIPDFMNSINESCKSILLRFQVGLDINCKDSTISMDPYLIQIAMLNLVENAARASKPGQLVHINVNGTTFEVSDHGTGIPQEELLYITDPFYVVDSSRCKKYNGFGLGLSLVKEIVEAHGSVLYIESVENMGTTVRFTLKA